MEHQPCLENIKKKYVEMEFKDNASLDSSCVANKIVWEFSHKHISAQDNELIFLLFKKKVSQEEFNSFIENWDIEKEGGHKAVFLSYFMKSHPELKYPKYIEPRLKGLIKYCRFENLKLIAHFKKICTKLKEAKMDILIFKGGAIHFLRPELPRIMGDIDIILREKDYEKAKKIIVKMGYNYKELKHSMDLHEGESRKGILDIHRKIYYSSGSNSLLTKNLFKRARKEKIYNVEQIYFPSYEDIMFILLTNTYKNLIRNTSIGSVIHSIFDCQFILQTKPNLDWNIVKKNAIETKTQAEIYIAAKFINKYLQDCQLPEFFEKEFKNRFTLCLYNKWFLQELKEKSHNLKIKEVIKNKQNKLKDYFKFRAQYFLYKRKTLRENPKLANIVLKKQQLVENNGIIQYK